MDLYRRVRWRARLSRWCRVLIQRPCCLANLNHVRAAGLVRGSHSAGVRTVPIRYIRGSECRSADFDSAFRPLHQRNRQRWLSVAAASLQGIALPPVTLIQVGDIYFVRDGHHRISVARALGEEYIEAEVIVWALAQQLEPARDLALASARPLQ
jgi:hypothetical protein